ncbi:MAG: sensor histidine kinase, partial [Ktedonobacterales bacterium]
LRLPRRRVEVEADRDAVGRVITNLLSNADKYSPVDRPIALSLRADGQGQAHVTVRDQGPGIPKAERQRIWEQFHRVPGVEGREMAGGLGLGLAICRGIIEQLGGQIGVKSQVGVGSTFWFTLSLAPGAHGTPAL